MEIYCNPEIEKEILEICKSFNLEAQKIGFVEKANKKGLTIASPYGTFEYN
jgi:phosphoribosylformylglycinamidine cyclo-ligase